MERHLEREIEELRGQLAKTNEELKALGRENQSLLTQVLHAKALAVLREERLEAARTELVALLEENETLKGEREALAQECQEVAIERDQLRVQCKSLAEEQERLQGEVGQLKFCQKNYHETFSALGVCQHRLGRMRIQRDELRRVLRGRR